VQVKVIATPKQQGVHALGVQLVLLVTTPEFANMTNRPLQTSQTLVQSHGNRSNQEPAHEIVADYQQAARRPNHVATPCRLVTMLC
jgi:hypothetical protein